MAERFADQEFVEYVVKSIVDHPDDVKTERTIDEMGVLITLSVHAEDMGQMIGRQGQTAKSVRTLLRVIGAKNDARVNLKILEPEGGKRAPKGDMAEGASAGAASAAPSDAPAEEAAPQSKPSPMDDLKI
jgi:predicted RNA-binding protein YlqC (UPF0109 family)